MSETLFHYYERELTFIRQLAQDFARQYPAAAGRLLLEPNRSTDPHVERLIESFALLAGRVQHKIDDEFPELTDALLGVLYPHYLAPIPSMAIVQFVLDPARSQLPDGFAIPRHSPLHTHPVGNLPCKYRTGYAVTLWPVELAGAEFLLPPLSVGLQPPPQTAAALRLRLVCTGGMSLADLSLGTLRFYLTGESETIATFYDLLFNHATQVVFQVPEAGPGPAPIFLSPRECLDPVGFARDEGLLPYPDHAFPGYRLLSEFFAFPHKFHFLDLGGLDRACRGGFTTALEVIVFFDRGSAKLEQDVDASTLRLGCTPVVNLFEQTAEPIPLTQARSEYRIVPDVANPDGMEVYSVDSVVSADPLTATTTEYQPFYSFRHGMTQEDRQAFWYASRRPSLRPKDRATDVYLSLVDLGFKPSLPAESTLVIRTTCTNRDLPRILQQAGERLQFGLEMVAPLSRVRCLRPPSHPLRPPLRRGAYWRLISHLCLNHLSISGTDSGRETLQEILRLYDFSDPEVGKQMALVVHHQIEGILSVKSRRVVGRIPTDSGGGFCRGIEITIEFDEQKYVGTSLVLFASVLERFLGLYTTINAFSQLVARTKQGEAPIKVWPPRAGEQPLL
jgi:type VI secretion system protein ImpG